MTTPTPRILYVSSIRLAAMATAVGLSRAFIRRTLATWQLADHVDAAELVGSELVTNAVKTAGIAEPEPTWDMIKAHHVIGVQLRLAGASLYVEVWDPGDGSPEIPGQSPDAEGGRGLFLVEALSTRWEVYRPPAGGKVVWAELPLPAAVGKPFLAEGLPRCDPGGHASTGGAAPEPLDTALTQRVVDGLHVTHRRDAEAVTV